MKTCLENLVLPAALLLARIGNVLADTRYVDVNSTNATPPYTSWSTASTNIQNAVDAAVAGDEVVVTNGLYATGGRAVYGTMTNRVAVDKPLTLRSVNGPQFTVIQGYQVPVTANGDGAIRCVFLTNGASLSGFTLTNGATRAVNDDYPTNRESRGGGLWCESASAVASNCLVVGNSALYGGGAYNCRLNNCTLAGNRADVGGGVSGCLLENCILVFNNEFSNDPFNDPDYDSSTINNSWVGADPFFADYYGGNLRLQSGSPCINAGNNAFAPAGPDLDGRPRIVGGTVDIGAYEYQPGISGVFIGWLQQYNLPTDGSADYTDPDGDRMNNWQEWRCRTDPTNAHSVLHLLAPATDRTNVMLTWQSVTGVNYFLERSPSLAAPSSFTAMATNIFGQTGTTTYTDTNAAGAGPFFYRVGVGN